MTRQYLVYGIQNRFYLLSRVSAEKSLKPGLDLSQLVQDEHFKIILKINRPLTYARMTAAMEWARRTR